MVPVNSWIADAIARWVALVLRFRWFTVIATLVAAALCMTYAARNLGINTDTANMISASLPWRQHVTDFRESFPVRDRNLIVVVDAATPEQAERVAAALADRLDAQPDRFHSVFLAGHGEFFERYGLLYLGVDELENLADRLAIAQPLLGRLQQRFDGAGLVQTLTEAVTQEDAELELADALYAEFGATIRAAARGDREPVSWQRVLGDGGAEVSGGGRSLLLLQPVQDFTRVSPAAGAIEAIRQAADAVTADEPGLLSIRLTGSVALEHEELTSVSHSAGIAGLLALVMVAAVLLWALRSLLMVAIAVTTLVAGLLGTAAFAAFAVGHLNLLSVAFAVLYIGLGIDFIIHMCLRTRELLSQNVALDEALVETARSVGSSLVICAITTAAGFYAFIPTPFQGVSELGLISGTGMFISLFASLTLLPALCAVLLPLARHTEPTRWFGARLGRPVSGHPRGIFTVAALVFVVSLLLLPWVSFDSNPVHLRDPNTESVRTLDELADGNEAAMLQLIAIAPDHDTALAWEQSLLQLSVVREVRTAASLVPADQEEKVWVLEDLGLLMGRDFSSLQRLPPDPDAFLASLRALRAAVLARPDDPALRRLRDDLDTLLPAVDGMADADAARVLDALEHDLLLNLPGQLERLEAGLAARPFDVGELPATLTDRWFTAGGRELIEIVAAGNMLDDAVAREFVAAVREIVPSATGTPVIHLEASSTVVRSFQLAFLYALIMVFVLLLVFLRDLKDALLVLVPIVFAATVTAGLTVLLDIPFNFANVIALPLLMGVGVDSSIHIVHRMRAAPPRDGLLHATSTARAVYASGLTTIASFGNLAFATHVGMASMGKLLTIGLVVSMLATLVLLPALLRLRDGNGNGNGNGSTSALQPSAA